MSAIGAGVDYDGSKTSFESSANYSLQEFANDVVYTIKSVCHEENVPEPNIITESGRVLVAYHAILITNIIDEIETVQGIHNITLTDNEPQVIVELHSLYKNLNAKNFLEYYHGALEQKRSYSRSSILDLSISRSVPRESSLLGGMRQGKTILRCRPDTSRKSLTT